LTVEAKINFSSVTGTHIIIGQHSASPNRGWELRIKRQGGSRQRIQFVGSTNGTSSVTVQSSNQTLSSGTWYHVAATFSQGTVRIYLNGAQIGSGTIGTVGTATLFNTGSVLRIGNGTSSGFNGSIDEARVSQVVRYTAPFTGSVPAAPFIAD
jgi:hypothetical protein